LLLSQSWLRAVVFQGIGSGGDHFVSGQIAVIVVISFYHTQELPAKGPTAGNGERQNDNRRFGSL
jgi:hypothetical protein